MSLFIKKNEEYVYLYLYYIYIKKTKAILYSYYYCLYSTSSSSSSNASRLYWPFRRHFRCRSDDAIGLEYCPSLRRLGLGFY